MQMKGHKKAVRKRRPVPWPRKFVLKHTSGKCPYCTRHVKNIEAHIDEKHEFEKPRKIKGTLHGRD
jgi:transposase